MDEKKRFKLRRIDLPETKQAANSSARYDIVSPRRARAVDLLPLRCGHTTYPNSPGSSPTARAVRITSCGRCSKSALFFSTSSLSIPSQQGTAVLYSIVVPGNPWGLDLTKVWRPKHW